MNVVPPSPEEQIDFLRRFQRLLMEGQFTASYKFALLLAIADLCVLKGDDSGTTLELQVSDIAEKFIELYWQQCRPFQSESHSTGNILQQNTGGQAAVIKKIVAAQNDFGGSLSRLKLTAPDLWRSLTRSVKRVVIEMPLWKLQTVGAERLDFLYENLDTSTRSITLKRGVAFCFRAYYGMLKDLIHGAWVRFVQKLNADQLGSISDLSTFLFDHERSSLEPYRKILEDVQKRQCFYCHKRLRAHAEVDHFIPWSRYPTDLGHNFVLAHRSCNNAKSDYLASEQHLESWSHRIHTRSDELAQRFSDAGLPANSRASLRITQWAYEQLEQASGQVWQNSSVFLHLGPTWRELLLPGTATAQRSRPTINTPDSANSPARKELQTAATAPIETPPEQEQDSLEIVPDVPAGERFTRYAPVYNLSAAAGGWGPEGTPEISGWVLVPNTKLNPHMFVAQVHGQSMEPLVPSGAWCLFRPCPAGSRQGRRLLVQLSTSASPDDGGRYTLKKYHSEKTLAEDGWEHQSIELQPLNSSFPTIVLDANDPDSLRIVGELVTIL